MVFVARCFVGHGQLRPDRDALAHAGRSDQQQRPLTLLTPGIDVIEPLK